MTELVHTLSSPTIAAREEAMQALIAQGIAAGPQLAELAKSAENASLRARAFFTLAGIRLHEEARVLDHGPLRIELRHQGTLGEAAARIGAQARVHIFTEKVDAQQPIELALDGVSILAALDGLCAAAGCSWKATSGGNYRLWNEPAAATPLFHRDSFRVCLLSVSSERANDFRNPRLRVSFQLETQVDFLSPLARPLLKFMALEDGAGAEWPITVTEGEGTPFRMLYSGLVEPPFTVQRPFVLRGKLLYALAAAYEPINLERLEVGQHAEVGGIRLWIDSKWTSGYTLGVSGSALPAETPDDLVHHLMSTAVLGIDEEGKEALATVSRRTMVGTTGDGHSNRQLLVHLDFANSGLGKISALRLRMRHGITIRRVPFHFQGIEL